MENLNITDSLSAFKQNFSTDNGMRARNEKGRVMDEWRRATPFLLDQESIDADLWLCGPFDSFAYHDLQPQSVLVPASRARAFGLEAISSHHCFHIVPKKTLSDDWFKRFVRGDGKIEEGDAFDVIPADAIFDSLIDCAIQADIPPVLGLFAVSPKEALVLMEKKGWLRLSAALLLQAESERNTETYRVRYLSSAIVPIKGNQAELMLFQSICGRRRHIAMRIGTIDMSQPVSVRLHSVCLTGDTLGSLRCDCGVQLKKAIQFLSEKSGILLYLDQEGRGVGLSNKLQAYRLQDNFGLDTVEANLHQGLPNDARSYEEAVDILKIFNLRKINLLTNNPEKIRAVSNLGIEVVGHIPHHFPSNIHNRDYLEIKRKKMGHQF